MTDFKNSNAATTTITRNMGEFEDKCGNVYEAVVILSKRANQLGDELKEELTNKLNEFASTTDNLEEIFENREQIEISRFYESLPKPTAVAADEFINDKVYFRRPGESTDKTEKKEKSGKEDK